MSRRCQALSPGAARGCCSPPGPFVPACPQSCALLPITELARSLPLIQPRANAQLRSEFVSFPLCISKAVNRLRQTTRKHPQVFWQLGSAPQSPLPF